MAYCKIKYLLLLIVLLPLAGRLQAVSFPSDSSYFTRETFSTRPEGENFWPQQPRTKGLEKSSRRCEIVFYPLVTLDNHSFDKIYHYSLSVGPAVEFHAWKGGKFTMQPVFPLLSNDRRSEQTRIHAGINTFEQTFRVGKGLVGRLSAGLFSSHRCGVDLKMACLLPRSEIFLTGQCGCTGYFILDRHRQLFERWKRLTWAFGTDYYITRWQTQTELQYIRYLSGDCGVRGDVTRFFKGLAIGFYGIAIRDSYNIGFHFAVRLKGVRRDGHRRFRVRAPYYFDWQYSMKSKTHFSNFGSYYETAPDWHHGNIFWHELRPSAYRTE